MLFCPFGENLAEFAPTFNKYARWYGICHVKCQNFLFESDLLRFDAPAPPNQHTQVHCF
ncbi:hypothetical protein N24_1557 [Corynebacterium suranareeae]|uniref:Uncharacterized protein n=1 Tax=Corynebacterium suranareeae TaxID=2506452 RepID=A0A160PPG7_9CORY|nr:hypothetical protein N24_1557 [Corynebacterium suranareeae]